MEMIRGKISKAVNEVIEVKAERKILSTNIISRFAEYLDVSANTVKTYKTGIKVLIAYLNKHGVNTPNRENILNFKRYLIAEGKKSSTIALYLSSVRRFFAWCESERIYPNIAQGIKAPKQDKGHKRDCFTSQAVKDIMRGINRNTLEGKRNFAMIALMTCGGLRTVEVIRANVEDIRTLGDATVLYVQGKGHTDKKDFIKIPPPVAEALREYFTARGHVRDSEPLFASLSHRNAGKRLTTRTVSGVCKQAMKKAGYDSPRLTAHSLRHSAATLALLAGVELTDVSAFMRHSNINITMIYNHSVNRLKSLCESSVTSAIFGCERLSA